MANPSPNKDKVRLRGCLPPLASLRVLSPKQSQHLPSGQGSGHPMPGSQGHVGDFTGVEVSRNHIKHGHEGHGPNKAQTSEHFLCDTYLPIHLT